MFSLGLPAYILIKILVTCFFAREDTKTPLYVSIISVIVNLVLSLLLISTMREMGIALATAISAWINALLLLIILRFQNNLLLDSIFLKNILKIIISTLVMLIGAYTLNEVFFVNLSNLDFSKKLGSLFLVIICCKIIYLTMIFMFKVISLGDLKGYIQK